MSTVFKESVYLGDLLKFEEDSLYSRDTITVAAGQNMMLGTVLGMLGTKAVALSPAASDGSETVMGILIDDVDATEADTEAVMVCRNAIVSDLYVIWPLGISTAQKSTAIAQLNQLGVVIRQGA
jgi:hypothetical protein